MRYIDKYNSTTKSSFGWKRHLRSSLRQKKCAITEHIKRFGPTSALGRQSQKAKFSYVLKFFKQFSDQNSKELSERNSFALPEKFCFIEHPEESLFNIWASISAFLQASNKRFVLDHTKIKRYNLTSEALLAVGIEAVEKLRRLQKKKVDISGIMSKDKDHQQLISEIGIIKELNAQTTQPLPYSREQQHLFSYKSINKSTPSPHSQDDKTIASEKLAEHVNDCIRDHKLELTDNANTALMKSVSEVLDNAERHCSSHGNSGHIWYARGYLNSHSEHQNFEISIFNFGATIASTFLSLPKTDYSRLLVMDYVNAHLDSFSEEQLITVAALQHRYSCKNRDANETNGQGTVVLIQFFEQLCKEFSEKVGKPGATPMMSIVSGKTHILFDGTYKLSPITNYTEKTDDDDEQFIIAFNDQKSLKSPPDPRYVRTLEKTFFPGVAISIRFPLKEESDT